jgi:hypothetical protein
MPPVACLLLPQVTLKSAGPFSQRGTYRVAAVLYDGYQPVQAGPDLVVR